MAIVVLEDDTTINVTFDGVTDWDCTAPNSGLNPLKPYGIRSALFQSLLQSVNDTITLREHTATGPIIAVFTAVQTQDLDQYHCAHFRPHRFYVKASEVTAGAKLIIVRANRWS